MIDFNIFREENLFRVEESDFIAFQKYLRVLVEHPHPFQPLQSSVFEKLYFFQDVWFFIHYGEQYKVALTEKDVTLKKVRLSFLKYLGILEELEATKMLSEPERFIFCYRYLSSLFSYFKKIANEEKALQEIHKDYYKAINHTQETDDLQQNIIDSYYSSWFKHGYVLSKLFQEKLGEAKQICSAMQDVCGLSLNEQENNMGHFIQAVMKSDDLLEITFWKKKFKEHGLSTLFEYNDGTNLPTLVVCAQQSEGMRPLLNMQIGLICAILAVSEKEARDFVYIPYAEQIGTELYCEKGHMMIAQYMEIVQQFLGGNETINYRQLLNIVFTMLKLSATSSSGEIILICDDKIQAHVPQDEVWKKAVQQYKDEMDIRIIVLYSGTYNPEMSIWFADGVIFIEEFQSKMEMM